MSPAVLIPIPMKNVYVIGAGSTGKTTIINALEVTLGKDTTIQQPVFIREVARSVLKEKAFTRECITSSPTQSLQLQQYILEAQVQAEDDARKTSDWYICDRSGLDPVAYAQMFVSQNASEEMLASNQWKVLEQNMKEGGVFLCEAGGSWLVDDGTRLMPADAQEWARFDAVFRELLKARCISYTVIPKNLGNIEDRVDLVLKTLGAGAEIMER